MTATQGRGQFITVEGVEGVGKSTNIAFIRRHLEAAGRPVVVTREPGGTALGEEIRSLLLQHRSGGMTGDAELLLVFAARAEHLAEVIRPALARGTWVVSDRFTDATYAYQGGGRGIEAERIAAIETWVQRGLCPDLTFILDLPVETGLARAGQRSAPDRFEQEHRAFFERVRETYLRQAQATPARYRVIDAAQTLHAVQAQIAQALTEYLASIDRP